MPPGSPPTTCHLTGRLLLERRKDVGRRIGPIGPFGERRVVDVMGGGAGAQAFPAQSDGSPCERTCRRRRREHLPHCPLPGFAQPTVTTSEGPCERYWLSSADVFGENLFCPDDLSLAAVPCAPTFSELGDQQQATAAFVESTGAT